ncbi:hypothetical protein PENTCL1PPCAC_1020, partial [Pristionchus entomophagus]
PIIKSDLDNDIFNTIALTVETPAGLNASNLLLGLVCNQRTRRLEWADGDHVGYTTNKIDLSFDCTQKLTAVSEPKKNDWYEISTVPNDDHSFTVLCATLPLDLDDKCAEYQTIDDSVAEDGYRPCVRFSYEHKSWTRKKEALWPASGAQRQIK